MIISKQIALVLIWVESYKRCQNVLNCSLKIAKSAYYHWELSENKGKSKKLW